MVKQFFYIIILLNVLPVAINATNTTSVEDETIEDTDFVKHAWWKYFIIPWVGLRLLRSLDLLDIFD